MREIIAKQHLTHSKHHLPFFFFLLLIYFFRQKVARDTWALRGEPPSPNFAPPLLGLLGHKAGAVRGAASRALAGGLSDHPGAAAVTLQRLVDLFHASPPPPVEVLSGAAAMAAQVGTLFFFLAKLEEEGHTLLSRYVKSSGA